eukprot:753742-Hanusia_phi.AAC.1
MSDTDPPPLIFVIIPPWVLSAAVQVATGGTKSGVTAADGPCHGCNDQIMLSQRSHSRVELSSRPHH